VNPAVMAGLVPAIHAATGVGWTSAYPGQTIVILHLFISVPQLAGVLCAELRGWPAQARPWDSAAAHRPPRARDASVHSARVARISASRDSARTRALA
jgi:hypothetical protein